MNQVSSRASPCRLCPLPGPRRRTPRPSAGTDYLVSVRHPMFVPQEDREATVYARIESILPVMLEPVI